VLEPVEVAARLHRRIEIGARERESVRPEQAALRLNAFPVFAFCAEITRLPSHCDA
jgi:hypothetical protein